jgi:nucleoside-diphosphate-sugar epimerase
MTDERVLLVGGAGFVGSALAAYLRGKNMNVGVLDSYQQFADPYAADHTAASHYRHLLLQGSQLIRGDARNVVDLQRAIEAIEPTLVVHLAAVARAPLNEELRCDAVTTATVSAANTVQLAARSGVRRVLLVSSSYVYGDFQYDPCDESHPTDPRTTYGATKLSAEILTRAFTEQLGIEHTIVRLIAVYGPWDLNGKLSVQNLREAVSVGVLPIASGPGETTDYTHIDDAVRGLGLALTAPNAAGQTLNISAGHARKPEEVADAITAHGIATRPEPERVGPRPRRGALDISRARQLIGFLPTVSIEDGIGSCLEAALGAKSGAPISMRVRK